VPAARNQVAQIQASSATVFGLLLKAIDWREHKATIQRKLDDLKTDLGQLSGLATMNNQVQKA